MTEEPWNKHTPGDPMPCKCGDSVVRVKYRTGGIGTEIAEFWHWGKITSYPTSEIIAWRFVERKGEDVIAADPYDEADAIRSAARRAILSLKLPKPTMQSAFSGCVCSPR